MSEKESVYSRPDNGTLLTLLHVPKVHEYLQKGYDIVATRRFDQDIGAILVYNLSTKKRFDCQALLIFVEYRCGQIWCHEPEHRPRVNRMFEFTTRWPFCPDDCTLDAVMRAMPFFYRLLNAADEISPK